MKASVVLALVPPDKIEVLYSGSDATAAENVFKSSRGRYPEIQMWRKPVPFKRWKGEVADLAVSKPRAKKFS
jgi:hypothetical protein